MGNSNARPLVFLATCLAFAETALGTLAGLTDADPTIVAAFALASLGMVLLSLVAMYFREPAFLTFTGEQALDLRVLQEIGDKLTPELLRSYVGNLRDRDLSQGPTSGIADLGDTSDQDAEELEAELRLLSESDEQVGNQI